MSFQYDKLFGVPLALFMALLFAAGAFADLATKTAETSFDVAPVWSGHPVGFALLSRPDRQFVAFYDAERKLTVASRKLSEASWHFVKLPETLGWDSHNYVTMAVDDDGCIHLCANMHVSPLVYFRTAKPGDIDSFERVPAMLGRNEIKCTYPSFFRGPANAFLFTYRDGYSGNGDQLYNVYDTKTKSWRRLMEQPLTSGGGKMNAYLGPLRMGPDGYYHLVWVWRDNSGCESNHDVCYARSRDLVHWERSGGQSLQLPITLATADVVDAVPVRSGLINGNVAIGFDSKKRPIVSYHKYDEQGFTQIYNARLEGGRWNIYKTSSWNYRWEFSGSGSISFEIRVLPVLLEKDGRLSQSYVSAKLGSGKWILDNFTLKPISDTPEPKTASSPAPKVDAQLDALGTRTASDSGSSGEPGVRYMLRWETLGVNRDKPYKGVLPPHSMLKLIRIETVAPAKK